MLYAYANVFRGKKSTHNTYPHGVWQQVSSKDSRNDSHPQYILHSFWLYHIDQLRHLLVLCKELARLPFYLPPPLLEALRPALTQPRYTASRENRPAQEPEIQAKFTNVFTLKLFQNIHQIIINHML